MVLLKQLTLTPLCIKCGSWFCENSLFCETCFAYEIQLRLEVDNSNSGHVYLFDWHQGESQVLNQLVYRLKSNNAEIALKLYTKFLADKIRTNLNLNDYSGVIPIPSANINSTHAHTIANELAARFGLNCYDILLKGKSSIAQKRLSAVQRKLQNPFRLAEGSHEDFTGSNPSEKSYIFVDDVLTTGQSFKHCSNAVYWSKRNVIATLFYRPSQL